MSTQRNAVLAHPVVLMVAALLMLTAQLMYYTTYIMHGTPAVSSSVLRLSIAAGSLWLAAIHARATKLQFMAAGCGYLAFALTLCAVFRFSGLL